MIKLGVVSDTHSKNLPARMIKDFQNVHLIVHAGDMCSLKDYRFFQRIQEVKAVYGNMDEPRLCQEIPRRQVFCVEGVKIGLCHGEGSPQTVMEFVQKEFRKDNVDVVIFGHSHYPFNEKIGKVLYFNPGSPNDIVRPPYCSYGLLEIHDKTVTAKIVKVGDDG